MTVRIVHINALLSLKVELWPSRFDYYAKYNVEMYTLWKIHITDTDDEGTNPRTNVCTVKCTVPESEGDGTRRREKREPEGQGRTSVHIKNTHNSGF